MNNEPNIAEIAERVSALREILGYTPEEMAQATGVSVDEYLAHEGGKKDFSFIFLYRCAQKLEVDMVELLTGENPHLRSCAITRAGAGLPHKRREGFEYYHLAANLRNKFAEPFLVKAPFSEEAQTKPIGLSIHPGQEMDYILKGSLVFVHEGHTQILNEGDCAMYDSGKPHGMIATGGEDCLFLTVVFREED